VSLRVKAIASSQASTARIDPVQAESAVASSAALQALEADAAGAVIRCGRPAETRATSRKAEADRALQRACELSSAGLLPTSELDTAIATATTAAALTAATAALAQAEQAQAAAVQRVAQDAPFAPVCAINWQRPRLQPQSPASSRGSMSKKERWW
jgi:hypothetical protein